MEAKIIKQKERIEFAQKPHTRPVTKTRKNSCNISDAKISDISELFEQRMGYFLRWLDSFIDSENDTTSENFKGTVNTRTFLFLSELERALLRELRNI